MSSYHDSFGAASNPVDDPDGVQAERDAEADEGARLEAARRIILTQYLAGNCLCETCIELMLDDLRRVK